MVQCTGTKAPVLSNPASITWPQTQRCARDRHTPYCAIITEIAHPNHLNSHIAVRLLFGRLGWLIE
jgi:hypothetical protein